MALGMCASAAAPGFAQRERANWAQNRQNDKPPKQQKQQEKQQQPQRRQERQQERQQQRQEQRQAQRPTQAERHPNGGANRPPAESNARRPAGPGADRAESTPRANANPNRPPSAYTPPPKRDFNNLNPQEKRKVLEDNRRLQNLPPAQRQELQERAHVWDKMTQPQRDHIKNDVLPKWKQMPPDRRQAIQQRLRRLQNMPESARNQRLNDPEFTRGMSEEDKATLHDLSHLHVGGAPDPPNE